MNQCEPVGVHINRNVDGSCLDESSKQDPSAIVKWLVFGQDSLAINVFLLGLSSTKQSFSFNKQFKHEEM